MKLRKMADIQNEIFFSESEDLISSPTYNSRRNKLKLSTFETGMILFESAVGIGLFTLHYPLKRAGVLWGLILNIFIYLMTSYGLTLLHKIANQIEEEEMQVPRIRTVEDLSQKIGGNAAAIVNYFIVISTFGDIAACILSNMAMTSTILCL